MTGNPVGEYLRARRERVRPEDVGIAVNGHRRVPGLRRDELAVLAGISTEYYTRLEQGRDRNPSARVLDALAGALELDRAATAHLHELAAPAPGPQDRPRPADRLRPSVARLLASWAHVPALVQGRHFDVLAANRPAGLLSPLYTPGTNLLRAALLDPAAEVIDGPAMAPHMIAMLRAAAGAGRADPRLDELVAELSEASEVFRRHWARHEVLARPAAGLHRVRHPVVGDLALRFDKFLVAGAEDQTLVVYQAEPGSASEAALARLLSG